MAGELGRLLLADFFRAPSFDEVLRTLASDTRIALIGGPTRQAHTD